MVSSDMIPLLEELVQYTKQNERWLRFLAWGDLRSAILDSLDEPWEFHAYEMLDGETSLRDIVDALPTSYGSVNRRCKRWRTAGIAVQTEGGQYDKIVSLEALNIEIPEIEDENEE